MRKEHDIMVAQKRHLEKKNIEYFNMAESLRKESEKRTNLSDRKKKSQVVTPGRPIDFKKSHIA